MMCELLGRNLSYRLTARAVCWRVEAAGVELEAICRRERSGSLAAEILSEAKDLESVQPVPVVGGGGGS